jgi:hypothetical protein
VPTAPPATIERPWIEVRSTKCNKPKALLKVSQSRQSGKKGTKACHLGNRRLRSSRRLHVAATALHCYTGLQVEYRQLLQSTDAPLWEASTVEEWARLAQGLPSACIPDSAGTNTLPFITNRDIPTGRKATYQRIVGADRPQKKQSKCVRVTVGSDKINYPAKVATKGANLQTVKQLFNSVISTPGAKFMSRDTHHLYLNTPMARPEYMRVALKDIPPAII